MIKGLEPVPLKDLRALGAPKQWIVEGHLETLPSLTPVRGHLTAEHRGNVLAVEGVLQTIVTLSCDRCLGQFNQQITSKPAELIWLGVTLPGDEPLQAETDIEHVNGWVECLDPRGCFDPEQWVFEQLNLQLPVVNSCGDHCPGPAIPLTERQNNVLDEEADPRWAVLRQLREP
ncbi:MAG: metal-binding protein [Cyanobium sp. NAT70]|nr:metal-binding protein [Cyanobium sp. NAT70]|tara:strand:- start:453 stop:974 length:522 start_codon:yes stop_codon:yes gene_type:complete